MQQGAKKATQKDKYVVFIKNSPSPLASQLRVPSMCSFCARGILRGE